MATRTFNTVLQPDTDANFRAWVQGVVDTIKAIATHASFDMGSDSGQLADPVVAVRPAVNTSAGYLILKTADTHHATNPLYFKFEFGSGSSQSFAAMWVTVGTGTDGAGTITGVKLARSKMNRETSATAGTVYEHAAGWGDGYFWMWLGINTTFGVNFGWERNRDTAGATKDDVSYFWHETTNTLGLVWVTMVKGTPASVSIASSSGGPGMPVLYSPQNAQGEYANLFGEVPVYPVEPFLGRKQPPLLSIAVVSSADVGSGVVIQATMYGSTKTFRRVSDAIGKFARGTGNAYGSTAIIAPALMGRWE